MTTLLSTKLFGRSLNLVIGFPHDPADDIDSKFNDENKPGVDVAGLDCEFVVEKSLKPTEPNTLSLHLLNLAPDTREKVSGQTVTVRLEAGYQGNVSQLYFAEARAGWTTREGADFITHIESTDTIARPTGVRKTKKILPGDKNGNLFRTFGPKVPIADAFKAIADSMGLKLDVPTLNQALATSAGISIPGGALLGNAARRMTDLCRSAGLEWSIQDGTLQILNIGGVLTTTKAILVSEETGMWDDSPAVDSQGVVAVTTALIPGLAPGVLVILDSLFTQGNYRVEKIRYVGSTWGRDWTAHFTASKY